MKREAVFRLIEVIRAMEAKEKEFDRVLGIEGMFADWSAALALVVLQLYDISPSEIHYGQCDWAVDQVFECVGGGISLEELDSRLKNLAQELDTLT